MLFEVDTARPERDEPSWQIAQNRDANEDAHNPGHARGPLRCERLRKQIVLHYALHALNHTHRPLALALHFGQGGFGNVPRFQGSSQDVCGYHSILDGVIDPHTSYRRHHMGSISNEKEAWLVPKRAATGLNGEQGELLPIGERFGMFGKMRLGFDQALTNGFYSLSPEFLIMSLGKDQTGLPVAVAFKNDEDTSAADTAKSAPHDFGLARDLWQAEPQHIHWRCSLDRFDSGETAHGRESAVGTNRQRGPKLVLTVGREVAHAHDRALLFH